MLRERLVLLTFLGTASTACGPTSSARAEERVLGQQERSSEVLQVKPSPQASVDMITQELPAPRLTGQVSLEEALARRRSVRSFEETGLTDTEIAQLSWAAQGSTTAEGRRTAPSAGALYPLELYVALPAGVYRYDPDHHHLEMRSERDLREELQRVGLGQDAIGEAPAVFVITGVHARTSAKYGERRTPRYVQLEAGHAAQNLLLQAVALGLGAVPMGAFYDDQVREVLSLPVAEAPLYLIPVGHPRE